LSKVTIVYLIVRHPRTNRTRLHVLVLLVAAAGLLLVLGHSGQSSADTYVGQVSVLSQPSGARDGLPDELQTGSFAGEIDQSAGSHYVGSSDGKNYYLVPGVGGRLCLLFTDPASPIGVRGGACFEHAQINVGVALTTDGNNGGRDAALIVPDGYTDSSVRGSISTQSKSAVTHNMQFMTLSGHGLGTATVSGRNLPNLSYDIPLAP
jgi:hypothetical protein